MKSLKTNIETRVEETLAACRDLVFQWRSIFCLDFHCTLGPEGVPALGEYR
jgi:hypothetical protein